MHLKLMDSDNSILLFSLTSIVLFTLILTPQVKADEAEYMDKIIKDPLLKKAWQALKIKNQGRALKILSLIKPKPESISLYYYVYGVALRENESLLDALATMNLAYHSASEGNLKELSQLQRARIYLDMKFFYEAQTAYKNFFDQFPESQYTTSAYIEMARSLDGAGDYIRAYKYYEKAGDIPEAILGRANELQKLGRYSQAQAIYSKSLSKYKNYIRQSDETLYLIGENLRIMGKPSEAMRFLFGVTKPPFIHKVRISLGLIKMKEGKYRDAVRRFKQALESEDRDVKVTALYYLATAQIKEGNTAEARVNLEDIRFNYPYSEMYDGATIALAKVYRKEEKFDGAVSLLRSLIFRPDPTYKALDEFEALLLAMKDKNRELFVDTWKSISLLLFDREREKSLLTMAEGLKDTTIEYVEVNLWLSDNGSNETRLTALNNLANFYADIGDNDAAETYIKKLQKEEGKTDNNLSLKAKVLYDKRDLPSTVVTVSSIKEMESHDLDIYLSSITSKKEAGRALNLFKKVLKEQDPDVDTIIRFADILHKHGKKRDSLKFYRAALKKDPENDWALYRIGGLTGKKEDKDILEKMTGDNDSFSNFAGTKLEELRIREKMAEVF